eukprot:scaffold44437_cov57-Attheya_sp.AAC.5
MFQAVSVQDVSNPGVQQLGNTWKWWGQVHISFTVKNGHRSRLNGSAGGEWVDVGFVDISLVEAPAIKRGGCGAYGKGRNGGKWDETVFWGGTK